MKKRLLLVILSVCLCSSAVFSIDFGVTVDNQTGVSYDGEASLLQKDKVALWFDTGLGENFSFTFQGSYTFNIERYFLMDVDVLKLSGKLPTGTAFPSLFDFSVGRIPFREFSEMVLAHRVDGLSMRFSFPSFVTSLSAGYTGLYPKPSSSIILTKSDLNNSTEDPLFFSSQRLIEKFDIRFFEVFLRQDLFVSLLFQQDLMPAADFIREGETEYSVLNGGKLNSHYFGAGFSGPLYAGFYLKGYGYLETGQTLSYIEDTYSYGTIFSGLIGLELNYYNRKFNNTNFGLRFVYSTGDEDYLTFFEGNSLDDATMFIPISRPDIATAFSPQLGNLFFLDFHGSIKPLASINAFIAQNLQLKINIIPMFRATTGPISEPGIDSEATALYLGTEIDSDINFRITSDVGTSLEIGFFIPNKNVFTDNTLLFIGKLNLMVSI